MGQGLEDWLVVQCNLVSNDPSLFSVKELEFTW